ncbi:MAG: hypothetical protein HKP11_06290 [Flavobacteriaceae bacterium]|nr:hypothetical protein [Flavobacteriaceae bacterium]
MAPNKIEDHIREKMQEREIKPSADAWAKLEARLGKEEKKKGMGRNSWFAIAASFIGILILASVFMNSGNDATSIDVVTEDVNSEEVNSEIENEIPELIPEPKQQQEAVAVDPTNSEENNTEAKTVENSTSIAKSEEKQQGAFEKEKKITTQVEEQEKLIAKVEEEEVKIEEQPMNNKDFVESKVDEVVAEVENRMKTNSKVTPEEVDDLLIQAQREISNRRILNSGTNKVDATALLEDVEFELERSFREKVFDALGDGFQKIRTAVAERNN